MNADHTVVDFASVAVPLPGNFVAFAWWYHGNTRGFAPDAAECCGDGPGVGHPVTPAGSASMETTGSPTFLGNPLVPLPCSPTPAGPTCQAHLRHVDTAPAATTSKARRRSLFRGSITQLQHSLSTLRRPGYPDTTQDSLPAVGQTLPDGIICP